jgi:predicted dienelactone hydrolase
MTFRIILLAIVLLFVRVSFAAVGFQNTMVLDTHGKPIAIGIWYPSNAQPSPHPIGLFSQNVAVNGKLSGERLPLVLISHGASGSLAGHYDTAIALAQAGFVVVALTHTGDNSDDQSYAGNRINLISPSTGESRPRLDAYVLGRSRQFESRADWDVWLLPGRIHNPRGDWRHS